MNEAALVRVTLRDRYTSAVARMNKATTAFRLNVAIGGESLQKFGTKMGMVSTKLANLRTGFLAMMTTRGLKSVIKESTDFATAMNKVSARTQESAANMEILKREAKRLGMTTKFSALEAAEGMAMLGERGFKTQKILKTYPHILTMATAGDLDLATASKMVTGTMNTFSLSADKAEHIADVYAHTAARTASDMTSLNAAMINAGPLADAAGMKFEELAALVGVMSNKNIIGAQAGTLLMNSFRNLIVPSNDAIRILQSKGFKKSEITSSLGELTDFTETLKLFHDRGVTVEEVFKIFQIRGAKAVAAMKGTHGAVTVLREQLDKLTGQSGEMALKMLNGITGTTVEAISSWQGLKLAIGEALEPATDTILKMATAMNRFVASHPKVAKLIGIIMAFSAVLLTIVTVVGVIAAAIAGIAILVGMIMGTAIASSVVAVYVGIVTSIVVIVASIVAGWNDMVSIVKLWGTLVKYYAGEVVGKIKKIHGGVILLIGLFNPFVATTLLLLKYWEKIGEVWDKISSFLGFGKSELNATLTSGGDVGTTSSYRKEETVERQEIELILPQGIEAAGGHAGGRTGFNLRGAGMAGGMPF